MLNLKDINRIVLMFIAVISLFGSINGLKHFDRITKACPSPKVNVWKVNINKNRYLINPAHVALFAKNNLWQRSHFLDDFYKFKWNIPFSYLVRPCPQSDICWAKLPDDDGSDALELDVIPITEPLNVDVVYRQPYHMNGTWVSESTFGATQATVYRTPSEDLIESIDIGFKGMSGAVALSSDSKLVGLFVKRASLIQLKKPDPPSHVSEQFTDFKTPFERFIADRLNDIDDRLQYLTNITLTRNDMHELGVVFDARRGIFLPSASIVHIIDHVKSLEIDDILGQPAPDIPKF